MPWALKITVALSGTSSSSSTKWAPLARSASTTWRLCTISFRTYTGGGHTCKGQLDDVDGAVHAGAEAAGPGQHDVLKERYGRHAWQYTGRRPRRLKRLDRSRF